VTWGVPEAGDAFTVLDSAGGELVQRVRFRSTRLLIGDRTSAEMARLLGAPALAGGRVFGVVTQCSTSRVPVITLLSAARTFLSREIPGWNPL
jgi:hypothetical protein